MTDFIMELISFIDDLAQGKMDIQKARTKATALQAKVPEKLTDVLLKELDAKIAALED